MQNDPSNPADVAAPVSNPEAPAAATPIAAPDAPAPDVPHSPTPETAASQSAEPGVETLIEKPDGEARNEAVVVASQPVLAQVAALPEADLPQPPRPLVPGAFLAGEYEIKELVMRGLSNFYMAHGGDYSQPSPFLVVERELPQPEYSAPAPVEAQSTLAAATQSTPAPGTSAPDAIGETEAAILASLGESETKHQAVPESSDETQSAQTPMLPRAGLESALFAKGKNFVQDGREYLICEWEPSQSLQDWREPTNDGRYLQVMSTLVAGLSELESKKLTADLTHDTLRFDADGDLKFFGFVDSAPHPTPLNELREINSFLLKHVFAESATMRLDNEWSGLALCEETKTFATKLLNDEYSTLEEVRQALPAFSSPGTLRVEAALLGDVGREREVNEDSGMILRLGRVGHIQSSEIELYAVADGMGGHEGGEIASDITLNALQKSVLTRYAEGLNWRDNVAVRAALWQMIEEANAAVLALTEEPKYRALRNKPGATLTFALRVDATLFIGNVGDSRGYKWNSATGLQAITKDHSYVQSLVDSGQLKPEEMWDHPDGSIITSHIGMQKLKLRDVYMRLAAPGEKILLVSDGVVDMLRDEEIAPFAAEENPTVVCKNLVDASNAAGGHDNITVLAVHFK